MWYDTCHTCIHVMSHVWYDMYVTHASVSYMSYHTWHTHICHITLTAGTNTWKHIFVLTYVLIFIKVPSFLCMYFCFYIWRHRALCDAVLNCRHKHLKACICTDLFTYILIFIFYMFTFVFIYTYVKAKSTEWCHFEQQSRKLENVF